MHVPPAQSQKNALLEEIRVLKHDIDGIDSPHKTTKGKSNPNPQPHPYPHPNPILTHNALPHPNPKPEP
jgi:hypothetical protein